MGRGVGKVRRWGGLKGGMLGCGEYGRWGGGEVGSRGGGEVGRWGVGKVGRWELITYLLTDSPRQ